MTAITSEARVRQAPANLRAFDMRRDLLAVADLVELCFAESLDADGRLYIRQMRQTARSGRNLDTLLRSSNADLPSGGFVWQAHGNIVGNLSLVPVRSGSARRYLIANVAVHPDYRRQGIARALTEAALDETRKRRADETWLQVDAANQAAQQLYLGMGFVERAARSTWEATPQPERAAGSQGTVSIRNQRAADWEQQQRWLERLYPGDLRWNLPLDPKLFEPGLVGSLQRLVDERRTNQWSAANGEELLGVLTWQSSSLHADRLWLAVSEEGEAAALPALLHHAHRNLRLKRPLALNYPAGRAAQLFEDAGFKLARNLKWMQLVAD